MKAGQQSGLVSGRHMARNGHSCCVATLETASKGLVLKRNSQVKGDRVSLLTASSHTVFSRQLLNARPGCCTTKAGPEPKQSNPREGRVHSGPWHLIPTSTRKVGFLLTYCTLRIPLPFVMHCLLMIYLASLGYVFK